MFSPWVERFFQWLRHQSRRKNLATAKQIRIAVGPPALQPRSKDRGLINWQESNWQDSAPSKSAPATCAETWPNKRITPLPDIRAEFLATLRDLPAAACDDLESRIRVSHSLRELWHLRPEVFKLVALHRDQLAAQLRLDRLNRHFPSDALSGKSHGSIDRLRTAP